MLSLVKVFANLILTILRLTSEVFNFTVQKILEALLLIKPLVKQRLVIIKRWVIYEKDLNIEFTFFAYWL